MATIRSANRVQKARPELHNGDRMTREEFHRVYEQMPENFRAELIGGIVYVSSPLQRRHGITHSPLSTLFYLYEGHTPGVETGDNTTILLGKEGEPQPDQYLRILPEFGGQTQTTADDYVRGAPELLAEIAQSNQAIALHAKKDDYARYGCLEYLVISLKKKELRWFDLKNDEELFPDAKGIFRLRSFPGLWIHGPALLARDFQPLMDTLEKGLASPEHAEFVRRLESQRMKKSKRKRTSS